MIKEIILIAVITGLLLLGIWVGGPEGGERETASPQPPSYHIAGSTHNTVENDGMGQDISQAPAPTEPVGAGTALKMACGVPQSGGNESLGSAVAEESVLDTKERAVNLSVIFTGPEDIKPPELPASIVFIFLSYNKIY